MSINIAYHPTHNQLGGPPVHLHLDEFGHRTIVTRIGD
jgi:hypothetical protein